MHAGRRFAGGKGGFHQLHSSTMSKVGELFRPADENVKRNSQIERFRRFINARYSTELEDPWQLHSWSVDNRALFWDAIWDYFCFIGEKGAQPLFVEDGPMTSTRARLPNAKLNFAENILRSHVNAQHPTKVAIHSVIEGAVLRSLTWAELDEEVRRAANALRKLGVQPGDRVAAYTANNAEAVVTLLATTAVGAIWSATPCEFGIEATISRLHQISPKFILVSDRYKYNGKIIDVACNIQTIVQELVPVGLQTVVVVGQLEASRAPAKLPKLHGVKIFDWNSFLDYSRETTGPASFHRGPAMAPIYILFSSGTTGQPKCIVHHAGGQLLSHAVGQALHSDLGPNDAFLMFTTFGWMMSVFYVSSLQTGATVVAYDGSPLKPMGVLWDLVEKLKLTMLGISPRYLHTLLQAKYYPKDHHDLSSLRIVLTTGAPLLLEHHDFMRDRVGKNVFLFNGSGGTDVCNHHVCGCVALPHHYGELQMPMLGSKIECWDDDGNPVEKGAEGNLVLSRAIPNQPLYFWNDPEDKKYRETYYEAFPGKIAWNQGDWVVVGPQTNGYHMLGRSDSVLNPSGVRFGSGEIYSIIDKMPEICNSMAVGQKTGTDERVVLFVELADGAQLDDSLRKKINKAIAEGLSRRHLPAVLMACPKIPMTSNGKRQEIAVKKILNGARIDQVNADPETLKWFLEQPELRIAVRAKL